MVSTLGAQSTSLIYPLLILALTGSPAQASWAAALRMLPYLLLSLPVGALIDRWDRRRVMLVCHGGRVLAVLSLALAIATDHLLLVHIYGVAVVEGAFHVFFNIAETASLRRVVALPQLPQATAQNQAGFAAAGVVGPALGSWLFQAAGRAVPFVVDVLCHLAGAWAVWRMRTSFTPAPVQAGRRLRSEVAEGLRWLWQQRLVRDMALITSGVNFVQAAIPLLLIVRARELGASEAQIGLVFSLGGIGAVAGAALGAAVAHRLSFVQAIAGSMAIQAALLPLMLWGSTPWWLGVVYALFMLVGPVYNVVQFSHRIALIPDALQGRVNSSFRLVAFALHPVGAALCGLLLERSGSLPTIWVFGLVYGVLALVALFDPPVRHAPRLSGHGG